MFLTRTRREEREKEIKRDQWRPIEGLMYRKGRFDFTQINIDPIQLESITACFIAFLNFVKLIY